MFQSFAKPFQKPIPTTGAAVAWYLSGGIAAANCIAAYQPKGAASLAASYTNLTGNATYNAALGVAPTWDITNGWKFNGSSQYLKTGVIPANDQTWSLAVRFSGYTGINGNRVIGVNRAGAPYFMIHADNTAGQVGYHNGSILAVSPALTSGTLIVAGNKGYRNGIADAGTITSAAGTFLEIYIGAINLNGSAGFGFNGYIQAAAIWLATMTASQALAVATAMNAL